MHSTVASPLRDCCLAQLLWNQFSSSMRFLHLGALRKGAVLRPSKCPDITTRVSTFLRLLPSTIPGNPNTPFQSLQALVCPSPVARLARIGFDSSKNDGTASSIFSRMTFSGVVGGLLVLPGRQNAMCLYLDLDDTSPMIAEASPVARNRLEGRLLQRRLPCTAECPLLAVSVVFGPHLCSVHDGAAAARDGRPQPAAVHDQARSRHHSHG